MCDALKSYFHPSNSGAWSATLGSWLSHLCEMAASRFGAESDVSWWRLMALALCLRSGEARSVSCCCFPCCNRFYFLSSGPALGIGVCRTGLSPGHASHLLQVSAPCECMCFNRSHLILASASASVFDPFFFGCDHVSISICLCPFFPFQESQVALRFLAQLLPSVILPRLWPRLLADMSSEAGSSSILIA